MDDVVGTERLGWPRLEYSRWERSGRRGTIALIVAAILVGGVILRVRANNAAPNACSFLTQKEISATIGSAVSAARNNISQSRWDGSGCAYQGQPAYVLVWSLRHGSQKMFVQQTHNENAAIGHDIGQPGYRAFSITDPSNLWQSTYVLRHGQYVDVEVWNQTGATPPGTADRLARLVVQRIR